MKPLQCLLVLGIFYLNCQLTESSISRSALAKAVAEAKATVDSAYLYSRKESLERVRRSAPSPSDVLRLMKQPCGPARSAVRAADYMENALQIIRRSYGRRHTRSINATDLITEADLEVLSDLTGCSGRQREPDCDDIATVDKFRTASSVCNNRKNARFGASSTPLSRWLPSEYQDNVSIPKGWDNSTTLPMVRDVSNRILRTRDKDVMNDLRFSYLVTIFGQWTDHDLTFTPHSPVIRSFSDGIDCDKSCERKEPCFPIKVPKDDPRFSKRGQECIPFFRSAPACGSGNNGYNFGAATIRQQMNTLTAFIDGGQVYGSDDAKALFLRDPKAKKGLLRGNKEFNDKGRMLLPFTNVKSNMCANRARITNDVNAKEVPCFLAGDERANENIALTTMHTLFFREHNRLARALAKINPHWNDERLYQEARKILGANLQVITYRDFLPNVVGPDPMKKSLSVYRGYDEKVDPSISNVFATAAFRFGHTIVLPTVPRLGADYKEDKVFRSPMLHTAFNAPWRVVFEGGLDSILRGLMGTPAKRNKQDSIMVDELRDRLFEFTFEHALDLAALNLQRGRDHGLPGYTKWRQLCGLSVPKNLKQLARVLKNRRLAKRLLDLYKTPENIDVWVGGAAEPSIKGSTVGPLFACLISKQFQRIRDGDRFWWENEGVFTEAQRQSIRKTSFSRIICDNTGITEVPAKPFLYKPRGAGYTKCKEIPAFDLSPWKENGTSGSYGMRGPQGPPGPPGPKGEQGPPGPAVKVAFSMRLGSDLKGNGAPIVFGDAIYNGQDSYDTKKGVFTCEQPGVYEFSFHCTSKKSGSGVDLMRNGEMIVHGYMTKNKGDFESSGDIIVKLEKGEKVWLQATDQRWQFRHYSTFSGKWIFEE